MNIERLIDRAGKIQFFSALGAEIDDASIVRIGEWDEWPGPEDPRVEEIGLMQQSLYERVAHATEEAKWSRALRLMVEAAAKAVPYIEGEDASYGPNIAVWSAAWTFALEELYSSHDAPVPAEVRAQLYWYERGHWPCALIELSSTGSPKDYVVY
ncbi:TPA: hypothetical protein QHA87_004912 [Aeromonas dhakensis]|nr:hypothetical protein [Aeromonas dhakensis]HDT5906576.1 hypothetical protein [Klebsiella michiganensis]HDT5890864.1 hypothetical protein [Aeromonas dhakensis]HDT5907305.1 hypothetical protein [Klebsiella michiganensis]HDT5951202.1 hypothetical protein [Klebsiella michiganensis]